MLSLFKQCKYLVFIAVYMTLCWRSWKGCQFFDPANILLSHSRTGLQSARPLGSGNNVCVDILITARLCDVIHTIHCGA